MPRQGQRPGNLLCEMWNERSQMVGPLALMFLLFRQPRPMAWAGQTTGPLARKETINPRYDMPTWAKSRTIWISRLGWIGLVS